MTDSKSISVSLQFISGVSTINPSLAMYAIHKRKRESLFFYFVPDTTPDLQKMIKKPIAYYAYCIHTIFIDVIIKLIGAANL
jgi:hypothetical protein